MSDKVIFCAYAENERMKSGVNLRSVLKRTDVYWKNAVVALYSVKIIHPECDVALVTNVDVPDTYKKTLQKMEIIIFNEPFDEFLFDENQTWGLAFYKLCAMKKMLNREYRKYIMLDTDCYMQGRMDDLFTELEYNLMLLCRNTRLTNKTEIKMDKEIETYLGSKRPIAKWGGEFIAGNKELLVKLLNECDQIYSEMKEQMFSTGFGDEFILALAADKMRGNIKNASGYISRFWTGTYRNFSLNYKCDPVSILHLPAEKNEGMIKMYGYIQKHDSLPKTSKAHRMLHLKHPSFLTVVKMLAKFILNKGRRFK